MHGVKDLFALDADREIHLFSEGGKGFLHLGKAHAGFRYVHRHYHGKIALQDRLRNIENIDVEETVGSDEIYDIQGRKVNNPTKGLYIINGKKVLVR